MSTSEVQAYRRVPRNNGAIQRYKQQFSLAQCECCGWTAPEGDSGLLHCHHVVPVVCGGTNDPSNLALLCPTHHAIAHRLFPKQPRGTAFLGLTSKTGLCQLIRLYARDPRKALARAAEIRHQAAIDHIRPFLERAHG